MAELIDHYPETEMSLLNDYQITKACTGATPMISPFFDQLIRVEDDGRKVISYGLSSYGYDIRLSPKEFYVFQHKPGSMIDPKDFDPDFLRPVELLTDIKGSYFILPGLSYGLGVSLERISMPRDVTAVCTGKSTMARCGIHANVTPLEAGWNGHITMEFSNASAADARIYANEGVLQLLFHRGNPCKTSYADRGGKYQNQKASVVTAKV